MSFTYMTLPCLILSGSSIGSGRGGGEGRPRLLDRLSTPRGAKWYDPRQAGEDDDPLSGAEQRMAGAEHQAVVAHALDDPQRVGVHDPRALHAVGERRVGHLDDDAVAPAQLVDVAKRREVGGAVPGDRGRPGHARQRRLVV